MEILGQTPVQSILFFVLFGGFFVPFRVVMTGQIYNFDRTNLQFWQDKFTKEDKS